jgi:hypothetical protein
MIGELIATPSPTNAASADTSPSTGSTTCLIGILNFLAKSQSRWSCAGTAMIAPVP